MLHQRLGPIAGSTPALAAALLAAATALTGCGVASLGGTSSPASNPVAAPSVTSTGSPSSPADLPTTAGPTTSTPLPSVTTTTRPSATTTSTAKPTPTTSPAKPTPTRPTARPTPSAPAPEPVPTEGDTLHVGDSGPYVTSVQQELSALGYWNGAADGVYGMLTAQAVMALQKAAGLGRDGVYGPATRQALRAGTTVRSRVGGTGIEIDKARQLLLVVRGGRVTTILNTSTGSGETYTSRGSQHIASTPAGSFSTFRSVDRLDKGPLGDLWRPRYFNGGIAVHGAGSIPGYPASHGCARLSNPAMNMIWSQNLMPIGGRVVVY